MMHNSKWIRQIVELQRNDGSWGCFHSLSNPTNEKAITTEQALRRLRILGLTKDDEPVCKALNYMRSVLTGQMKPPDRREKVLNWDAFEAHMTAAWIRIFEPEDSQAMPVALMWAEIVSKAFKEGEFDENAYSKEYRQCIPVLHKGERLIALSQFYMVNLLKGLLDKETESRFVDRIINNPGGIYYVYSSRIANLPAEFASRQSSFYLAALEQLEGYSCAGKKLNFAVEWILSHKDVNGEWDMGSSARDGICFPLSDSWRNPENRRRDCTKRIEKLLTALR
jgi:hypothetical protein